LDGAYPLCVGSIVGFKEDFACGAKWNNITGPSHALGKHCGVYLVCQCNLGVCNFGSAHQDHLYFTSGSPPTCGKRGKLCNRVSARTSIHFVARKISPKNTEVLAKYWNLRDATGETPQIKGCDSHITALRTG